jgi:hypothetical protein
MSALVLCMILSAEPKMAAMSTFLPSASISLGLPDEFSALDARMALDATLQSFTKSD